MHNWKRNGWRTADKKPVKNEDLWRRLDEARARHEIDWRWVKGHAGNPMNERADVLATEGDGARISAGGAELKPWRYIPSAPRAREAACRRGGDDVADRDDADDGAVLDDGHVTETPFGHDRHHFVDRASSPTVCTRRVMCVETGSSSTAGP